MSRAEQAQQDAQDESLDATDVDPTGNAVDNDAVAAKDRAAQDTGQDTGQDTAPGTAAGSGREHEGDEEEASPT